MKQGEKGWMERSQEEVEGGAEGGSNSGGWGVFRHVLFVRVHKGQLTMNSSS